MKDEMVNDMAPKLRESYIDGMRCIAGVYDFPSALMFSVETMSTIGLGTRSIRSGCTWATILLMVESILGIILPTLWTAIIIAKFRHKQGKTTVRFSRHAAISRVEGECRHSF